MIEYITTIKVKQDGEVIGTIKNVQYGYQFFPKGHRIGETKCSTINALKAHLEEMLK